jgi:hypothetical protein
MQLSESQLAAHVRDLEVLGFTRLPGYAPTDIVARARARLEELAVQLRAERYPGYSEYRPNDEQIFNLQNKDRLFVDLLGFPAVEQILMRRLNDAYYPRLPADHPNYIVGELIARCSGENLRMHIDSWMPAAGRDTWMMQVVFVLHDRTEADGCSLVVPGSHLSGNYADRDFAHPVAAPAKAGDVVMWDSRLWHGALPRTNAGKSWVVVATLQRWWVKQRFDITRSLPSSIYDSLTDRQRILLGYGAIPPGTEFEQTDTRGGFEAIPRNRAAVAS